MFGLSVLWIDGEILSEERKLYMRIWNFVRVVELNFNDVYRVGYRFCIFVLFIMDLKNDVVEKWLLIVDSVYKGVYNRYN